MAKWFDWLKERALVALELSEKEILKSRLASMSLVSDRPL